MSPLNFHYLIWPIRDLKAYLKAVLYYSLKGVRRHLRTTERHRLTSREENRRPHRSTDLASENVRFIGGPSL